MQQLLVQKVGLGTIGRFENNEAAGQAAQVCQTLRWTPDVLQAYCIVAFCRVAGTRQRDELGKIGVALGITRQDNDLQFVGRACLQGETAADTQVNLMLERFDMRAHHTRQRAFVGQRNGLVAQFGGLLYQLVWVRSTFQEAEV